MSSNVTFTQDCGERINLTDYSRTLKTADIITKGPWIDVRAFGAVGDGVTDDTAAVLEAISSAPKYATIFFPNATYLLGALGTITKPLAFEFGYSNILCNTNETLITIGFTGGTEPPIEIRHPVFRPYNGKTPISVLKIAGPNVKIIDANFFGLTTSHSLIWNYAAYGLKLVRPIIGGNVCPQALYFSQSPGDATFSYDFYVDGMDISHQTGKGITFEGGCGSLRACVIESCSAGGIEHTPNYLLSPLSIDSCYFESNSVFDIKFNPHNSPNWAASIGIDVSNCRFIGSDYYGKIILDGKTYLVTRNNFYQYGGITGTPGTLSGCMLTSIGDFMGQPTTGYTNGIADSINAELPIVSIGGGDVNGGTIKPDRLQAGVVEIASASGLVDDPWFKNYNPSTNTQGWQVLNVTPTAAASSEYLGQDITITKSNNPAAFYLSIPPNYYKGKRLTIRAIAKMTAGSGDAFSLRANTGSGWTYIPPVSNNVYWIESTFTEKYGYYDIPSNATQLYVGVYVDGSTPNLVLTGFQIWVGDVRFPVG